MNVWENLRNRHILLIDDDEWIRDSLKLFLDAEGCMLDAFETGEEAIRAVQEKHYDIIIVDYRLPGINGIQFLMQARTHVLSAKTILISAYGNEDLRSQAESLGVEAFLPKPITADALETVMSCLSDSGNPNKKGNNERDK